MDKALARESICTSSGFIRTSTAQAQLSKLGFKTVMLKLILKPFTLSHHHCCVTFCLALHFTMIGGSAISRVHAWWSTVLVQFFPFTQTWKETLLIFMNNWNWNRALHTMRAPLRKCQRAAQQPHSSNGIYSLRLLHSEYSSQEIIILVDTSTLTCWISISKLVFSLKTVASLRLGKPSWCPNSTTFCLRSALFLDCGVANTNPQSCFLPKYYEKQTFHCISAASKKYWVIAHWKCLCRAE